MALELTPETKVHRIGGANVDNLRPSALDQQEEPPGISVLLGGTAHEAAAQMRRAFPRSKKWRDPHTVGTAIVADVRAAGFDVLLAPTTRFANHGRLVHAEGTSGFTDDRLRVLGQAFRETRGC